MKRIENTQIYINKLKNILEQNTQVEILKICVNELFDEVLEQYPYINLPLLSIISTESLYLSVYYQEPNAITETLMIKQNDFDAYLWKCEDGLWYLDDLENDAAKIAEILIMDIPIFSKIPTNVKEIKELLEHGLMKFDPKKFPNFSESKPRDLNEVLSWDGKYILTGTNVGNLKILTYNEWENLIKRENFYN